MKVGTPKTHVSALLAGKRGIGDALAAKLERKCEKPEGWMDQSGGMTLAELNGYEGQLITLFRQAGPDTQHDMLADLGRRIALRASLAQAKDPKVVQIPEGSKPGLQRTSAQKRNHPQLKKKESKK